MTITNMASTHRQVVLDEAEDDVGADEHARAPDASAAVHGEGTLVVHCPQVSDEAHELL